MPAGGERDRDETMKQLPRGQTRLLAALKSMEGTTAQKLELIAKLKFAGLLQMEDPQEVGEAESTLRTGEGDR
jgi:hypothetical protein